MPARWAAAISDDGGIDQVVAVLQRDIQPAQRAFADLPSRAGCEPDADAVVEAPGGFVFDHAGSRIEGQGAAAAATSAGPSIPGALGTHQRLEAGDAGIRRER